MKPKIKQREARDRQVASLTPSAIEMSDIESAIAEIASLPACVDSLAVTIATDAHPHKSLA
jgi:hypothetical protein